MSHKDKRRLAAAPSAGSSSNETVLWVVWGAGLFWAVVVCLQFYKQSPFPLLAILDTLLPDQFSLLPRLATLLTYAWGLAAALLMAASAAFLGRLLLSQFMKKSGSSLEAFVLSTALGYGLLAYLVFLLGVSRCLYPIALKGMVAVLGVLAIAWFYQREEREFLRSALRELFSSVFPGGAGSFFGVVFLFILATDFVMAFTPELFYDALVYHLGAPNYYLHEHRLAPLDLMPAKFPFTIQMINLLGLALKDEMVTKLTHFFMLVLVSSGMLALGMRFRRRLFGIISAVAFCSIPTVQLNVWTSGVDMGVSLFGFLAAFCFFASVEEEGAFRRWFFLSGVFSGLAMASKYTAAYIPTVIVLSTVVLIFSKKVSLKEALVPLLSFCAIVLAVMLPWLIKNGIETGNPVYPFLSQVFGGTALEPWRYTILKNENRGLPVDSLMKGVHLLWDLTMKERSSLSFQGPMFLACLPFLIVGLIKERPSWLRPLLIFGGLVLVVGLSMTRLTRYLLPGFTVLACLLAFGLESVMLDPSRIRRGGVVLIFILAAFFQMSWAYVLIGSSMQPQNVLLGRESRADYVKRYHSGMNPNPPNQMYRYLEENFPKEKKVLLVGEEMAYPIHVRHSYSGVYDRGPLIRLCEESQTPAELAQKLVDSGITHLMVNLAESHRLGGYGIFAWSPRAFGVFCAFWENHLAISHMEVTEPYPQQRNPILLMEIHPDGAVPQDKKIQNIIGPVYEESEFPRMKIESDQDKLRFYEARLQEWPNIYFLNLRVQELRSKLRSLRPFPAAAQK